jgi:hypothetical protein
MILNIPQCKPLGDNTSSNRKYGGTATLLDPNRLIYSDVELQQAFSRAVNAVETLSKAIGD